MDCVGSASGVCGVENGPPVMSGFLRGGAAWAPDSDSRPTANLKVWRSGEGGKSARVWEAWDGSKAWVLRAWGGFTCMYSLGRMQAFPFIEQTRGRV